MQLQLIPFEFCRYLWELLGLKQGHKHVCMYQQNIKYSSALYERQIPIAVSCIIAVIANKFTCFEKQTYLGL